MLLRLGFAACRTRGDLTGFNFRPQFAHTSASYALLLANPMETRCISAFFRHLGSSLSSYFLAMGTSGHLFNKLVANVAITGFRLRRALLRLFKALAPMGGIANSI
jgi:hypothetical protein